MAGNGRCLGALALGAAVVAASCDSSVRFGGTGTGRVDRVEIPVDPTTPIDVGAGDFTIEWWMRADAADNATGTLGCGGQYGWITGHVVVDRDRWPLSGVDGRDFGVAVSAGGDVGFGAQNATGSARTVCTALPGDGVLDGAWHHVAVQRSAAGTLQIWVDGALQASGAGPTGDLSYPDGVSGARATDPFLVLGAEKHDAGPGYPSYAGLIDEVRISTVLRYTATTPRPSARFEPDAATAGLYHLDETGPPVPGGTGVAHDVSLHPDGPTDGVVRFDAAGTWPVVGVEDDPFAPSP
jgi:hypothetical protein